MNDQFLTDLLNQVSVSGCEEPVQDVVKEHMKEYADSIQEDDMGNVICVLNPESPRRIMLSAHADEIGLVVSHIMENGRLQVIERGGIIPFTYPGQQKRGVRQAFTRLPPQEKKPRKQVRTGQAPVFSPILLWWWM